MKKVICDFCGLETKHSPEATAAYHVKIHPITTKDLRVSDYAIVSFDLCTKCVNELERKREQLLKLTRLFTI